MIFLNTFTHLETVVSFMVRMSNIYSFEMKFLAFGSENVSHREKYVRILLQQNSSDVSELFAQVNRQENYLRYYESSISCNECISRNRFVFLYGPIEQVA